MGQLLSERKKSVSPQKVLRRDAVTPDFAPATDPLLRKLVRRRTLASAYKLRNFSVSALCEVIIKMLDAIEVAPEELAAVLDSGNVIFPWRAPERAELAFSSECAQWIRRDTWHADQDSSPDERDSSQNTGSRKPAWWQ